MAKGSILNLLSGFTQCMCRQRSALATQLWLLLSCCGQMMVLKGISANSFSSLEMTPDAVQHSVSAGEAPGSVVQLQTHRSKSQ